MSMSGSSVLFVTQSKVTNKLVCLPVCNWMQTGKKKNCFKNLTQASKEVLNTILLSHSDYHVLVQCLTSVVFKSSSFKRWRL